MYIKYTEIRVSDKIVVNRKNNKFQQTNYLQNKISQKT